MKERLLNAAMVILTVCALVVTGLVVRREFFPPASPATAPRVERVDDWRGYALAGQRLGPADAPVSVVVFSDYQCPFCAVLSERLRSLRDSFPTEVTVVYRHFPLPSHPHAPAAARASECAAAQGRFEPFHDALFAAQDSIGKVPWVRFASEAGVPDTAGFTACSAAALPPAVERDLEAGMRLGVAATPTLLINDVRLSGAQPLDTLKAYVRRALQPEASRSRPAALADERG